MKTILLMVLLMMFSFNASAQNIVPNPSLENGNLYEQWGSDQDTRPDKWHPGYRVSDASFFDYHWAGHTGSEAVRVEMIKNSSGDAKWYFEPVPAQAGKLYEVSDWYISNVPSRMYAAFGLADKTIRIIPLRPTPAYALGWMCYYDTVRAPDNAVNVTIFHAIENIGWMMTDDYYMGVAPYDVTLMEKAKADSLTVSTSRKAKIAREEEMKSLFEGIKKTKFPVTGKEFIVGQNEKTLGGQL